MRTSFSDRYTVRIGTQAPMLLLIAASQYSLHSHIEDRPTPASGQLATAPCRLASKITKLSSPEMFDGSQLRFDYGNSACAGDSFDS